MIGMFVFTGVFIIIIVVILIVNQYSYNAAVVNNNKIKSLTYQTINYNEDRTIIQDPSCVIVESSPTNDNTAEKKGLYKIRDYYILSSYNSCNTSTELQHNTISLNALKYVIGQGARLLDFEIYSLENKPIVSTSNNPDNYYMFQSSNYVTFNDVFETIINNAFNISTCPNPMDPLFVHLRVKSNNDKMLNNLATIFETYEGSTNYILGTTYSFEKTTCNPNVTTERNKQSNISPECKDITINDASYNWCHPEITRDISQNSNINLNCNTNNITEEPLYYFQNKIIVILDRSNTTALDCANLMEYVNLTSNSLYCRLINNFTMVNSQDQQELLEFNKRTMTIVTPDIGINKNNPDVNKSKLLGIQFNANNFYQKDNSLNNSINMFNSAGCAFILKPAEMRYYPITVTVPPPNPPGYSFKERQIKNNYIGLSI